jgi:hypothetical protein
MPDRVRVGLYEIFRRLAGNGPLLRILAGAARRPEILPSNRYHERSVLTEPLAHRPLAEPRRGVLRVRLFCRDRDSQDGSGPISRNHGTFGLPVVAVVVVASQSRLSPKRGHARSGLARGSRPVKTRGNRALCPPDRPQLRGICLTLEEPHPCSTQALARPTRLSKHLGR